MTCLENSIDRSWQWCKRKYFTNIFARIFVCLAAGVLLAEHTSIDYTTFFFIAVSLLLILITSTLRPFRSREWIFIVTFPVFLIAFGGMLARSEMTNAWKVLPAHETNVNCIGVKDTLHTENRKLPIYIADITSVPVAKKSYYRTEAVIRFVAKYDSLRIPADSSTIKQAANHEKSIYHNIYSNNASYLNLEAGDRLILNFAKDSLSAAPKLGDRFLISSRINLPHKDYAECFDYGRYLLHHGFSGTGWVAADRKKLISENNISGIRMRMYQLREKLVDRLRSLGIEGESLSILSAITLGDKGILSDSTKSKFSASGISHILVVSGMHVGFIYLIIASILRMLYARRLRIIWVIFGLGIMWFYAVLTGLAPSVVRATFMFTMMLVMHMSGTKYRVDNALALSAVILLLCNPFVIFDVGFQLSYLAVISIVYFYPHMSCAINKLKLGAHWWTKPAEWIMLTASVSISAQIMTMPIVLYNFHQFPIYFMITNLIVALLAPVIFIGGLLLLPLSYVPHAGGFCASGMSFLLEFLQKSVDIISSLPMSAVKQYISLPECLLGFVVILCLINWTETHKTFAARYKSAAYLLASIAILAVAVCVGDWKNAREERMTILDNSKLVVNVCSSRENIVFTDADSSFVASRFEPLWIKYGAPEPRIVRNSDLASNMFFYNGKSHLILRGNPFRYKKNPHAPMQVDCVIIGRGLYPSDKIFEMILPKQIILTSSVWDGYIPQFKAIADRRNIPLSIN